MSIRLKLGALLVLMIVASMAASSVSFIALQRRSLSAAAEEKVQLLLGGTQNMARESQLARDPLMLIDYLAFLGRDHPELVRTRVRVGDRWQGPEPPPLPPGADLRVENVAVPAAGGPAVLVEVVLSRRVLNARVDAAESALWRDMRRAAVMVLLGGVLLIIPLSGGLTRRLIEIERAMKDVGQGRLDRAVPASGDDEVARLARGLNSMTARLREVDDMKRTFVASVTHELRSPLFAIESYVKELLRESAALGPEDRRRLERIQANAARLANFVTSLLDMARIERGQLEYRPRTADVARLVEDAAEFHRSRARDAGLELAFEAEPGLPALRVDPDLITQVVTNLVANAIKFTRRGGRIDVRVRRVGGAIECSVADSGVGIAPEVLARLFRPFARGADPLRSGGTGLGLSIAKAIVERHGARLEVESEPGRGSRFWFALPPADNKSLTPTPDR